MSLRSSRHIGLQRLRCSAIAQRGPASHPCIMSTAASSTSGCVKKKPADPSGHDLKSAHVCRACLRRCLLFPGSLRDELRGTRRIYRCRRAYLGPCAQHLTPSRSCFVSSEKCSQLVTYLHQTFAPFADSPANQARFLFAYPPTFVPIDLLPAGDRTGCVLTCRFLRRANRLLAAPMAPHAIPYRARFRHPNGPASETLNIGQQILFRYKNIF